MLTICTGGVKRSVTLRDTPFTSYHDILYFIWIIFVFVTGPWCTIQLIYSSTIIAYFTLNCDIWPSDILSTTTNNKAEIPIHVCQHSGGPFVFPQLSLPPPPPVVARSCLTLSLRTRPSEGREGQATGRGHRNTEDCHNITWPFNALYKLVPCDMYQFPLVSIRVCYSQSPVSVLV